MTYGGLHLTSSVDLHVYLYVKNLFMQSALSLEDPLLLQWVLTSVILPRQPVSSYGKLLGGGE